jgi:serine/threonine protein kinase
MEFNLHARVDALQRGECGEEHFLQEILSLREAAPNLVWATLALIDQRYRRGHLTGELFRSINSRLARHALEEPEYGATVDLHPANGRVRPVTAQIVPTDGAAATPVASRDENSAHPIVSLSEVSAFAAESAGPAIEPLIESVKAGPSAQTRGDSRMLNGRYSLECVLGRGGMGTVYRALDQQRTDLPEGNRHVALKILNDNIRRRPELLADLRREFYCAQSLAHPNIVKVYEMHHDDDVAFYTMELLEGQLLSDLLQQAQPLPLERSYAWAIIRDVGAALTHAHLRKVVHGDLKPQNIMITKNGEVRILDFGASGASTNLWATSESLQRSRFPPVTLAYACCELLDGQLTDPRDDLYALACLSYELLAGEHPFGRRRSTEARELGMQPRQPPQLTARQWQALQLGLSWRREGRTCSVRDWLSMLGLEPAAERLPPLQAIGAPSSRSSIRRAVVPALLMTLIVLLGGLWALAHQRGEHKVTGSIASAAAASLPASALPTPSTAAAESAAAALPTSAPIEHGSQLSVRSVQGTATASPAEAAPETAGRSIAPSPARRATPNEFNFSADTYQVRSDEHFAEINIHRANDSRMTSSFEWWTEGASARPGSDFIAQKRTTQSFPNGRHWTKLFVRIVPNAARTHTQTFYVYITEPSTATKSGAVTRAAILIPPPSAAWDAPPIQSAQRQP